MFLYIGKYCVIYDAEDKNNPECGLFLPYFCIPFAISLVHYRKPPRDISGDVTILDTDFTKKYCSSLSPLRITNTYVM